MFFCFLVFPRLCLSNDLHLFRITYNSYLFTRNKITIDMYTTPNLDVQNLLVKVHACTVLQVINLRISKTAFYSRDIAPNMKINEKKSHRKERKYSKAIFLFKRIPELIQTHCILHVRALVLPGRCKSDMTRIIIHQYN